MATAAAQVDSNDNTMMTTIDGDDDVVLIQLRLKIK